MRVPGGLRDRRRRSDRAVERRGDWLDDAGDDVTRAESDPDRGYCTMARDGIVLFSGTA